MENKTVQLPHWSCGETRGRFNFRWDLTATSRLDWTFPLLDFRKLQNLGHVILAANEEEDNDCSGGWGAIAMLLENPTENLLEEKHGGCNSGEFEWRIARCDCEAISGEVDRTEIERQRLTSSLGKIKAYKLWNRSVHIDVTLH